MAAIVWRGPSGGASERRGVAAPGRSRPCWSICRGGMRVGCVVKRTLYNHGDTESLAEKGRRAVSIGGSTSHPLPGWDKGQELELRSRNSLTVRIWSRSQMLSLVTVAVAMALIAATASAESPSPSPSPSPLAPANDNVANAQTIHELPATVNGTTVAATTEVGERESACGPPTGGSVWYSLRTGNAERVGVDLAAGGNLDGTVDVFHAVRSQLTSVGCQPTDSEGKASLSFRSSKNGLYLIRVAALLSSQRAPFALDVFLPTPAVQPPGPPLHAGGTYGQVDRIQNINAAYSFTMRPGVSYLINLANRTSHACVSGALYGPGTTSFEEGGPLLSIHCGGYRLFTPGPGRGGRYSVELTPRESFRGVQRFHLEVARAGPAETAPGLALGNYEHAHGRLDGNGAHVLRLYRLDVTTHSNLTLKLIAPGSADFNLQLRNQNGNVIDCECGASGSQTLAHQLQPGRYYAIVSVRDATSGNYTLIRESRTITSTSISFGTAKAAPGQSLGIDVKVSPDASGPVTVDIERFDPVFGWQFYREEHAFASGGAADLSFTPPAVGRWRANATYSGSSIFSPSAVGFTYLLVS